MNAVRALNGLGCGGAMQLHGFGNIEQEAQENRIHALSQVNQLSGVADFDIITIGGKQYSANAILDKDLIANSTVKLYRGTDFSTPFTTVKAGQPIGKVWSWIKANSPTGQRAGGQLLMFYDSQNKAYYVKDDSAIDQKFLQSQGTLTVQEELKQEQQEEERKNDPISYYVKKLGLPALMIAGTIYVVTQFGKEAIKAKLT